MCSRHPETRGIALAADDAAASGGDASLQHGLAANLGRQIVLALRHRQDATILVEDLGVTVLRVSPEGPDLTASVLDERFVLSIGGWHDEFPSLQRMLAYIEEALDGALRIRRDYLNGKVWRITLERRETDGSWSSDNAIEYPRLGFQRKVVTTYLQNPPRVRDPSGA